MEGKITSWLAKEKYSTTLELFIHCEKTYYGPVVFSLVYRMEFVWGFPRIDYKVAMVRELLWFLKLYDIMKPSLLFRLK